MATLTPKLTLTGTAADFGSALALSVSKALTVEKPYVGISRETVTTTGGNHIIVPSIDARRFVYIKHTGVDSAGAATTQDLFLESSDSVKVGVLKTGEFCFMPIDDNDGVTLLQLEAASGTIIAEYAYFTVASV